MFDDSAEISRHSKKIERAALFPSRGYGAILLYEWTLDKPIVDLALYLLLYGLGFLAVGFWPPMLLVLPAIYGITLVANSRTVRLSGSSGVPGREVAWSVLVILQPLTDLPIAIPRIYEFNPESQVFFLLAAAFWAAALSSLALLLLLHLPSSMPAAPDEVPGPRP